MKEDRNIENELNVNNGQAINIIEKKEKFQNNKKENYLKNWNSRLFLHIDNDERLIALADVFITPDYKKHKEVKRIGFSSFESHMVKYTRFYY